MAQMVKTYLHLWENQVQSLGWEDPLEKGMATHSSILAWRIPWTEAIVHGAANSWTQLTDSHFHFSWIFHLLKVFILVGSFKQ